MVDYAALKNEINTDPAALGYAPLKLAGDDSGIANLLNQTSAATISRSVIPAHELWEAIVPSEWTALAAAEKQRVQTLLSMGEINLLGANTRASLQAAFAAGTTTRSNMTALLTRSASRAEVLFGVSVSHEDVAKALRAT